MCTYIWMCICTWVYTYGLVLLTIISISGLIPTHLQLCHGGHCGASGFNSAFLHCVWRQRNEPSDVLRFWKGTKLCRVFICRNALPTNGLTGELGSLSRLLSVVSTGPDMVTCSGCAIDFIRAIDQHPSFPRGVQSCFRFEQLDLQSLMHKSSYSVFGRNDMFSVLQCLLVSLGGPPQKTGFLKPLSLPELVYLCSALMWERKGMDRD